MECPFCSVDVADDVNFCPHCGRGVGASRTGRSPAPEAGSDDDWAADPAGDVSGEDETVAIDLDDTGEIPTVDTGEIPTVDAGDIPAADTGEAPTERVAPAASGPPTGPLRRCPGCGAQNSARRDRCGRCGVDLETGATQRRRHAAGPDEEAEAAADGSRSTKIVVAVLVLGAVIGTLAGLIATDRIGGEPAAEGPAFDEGVYSDGPEALEVSSVTASSTREPTGERRFDAASVVDGDAGTTWVAGEGAGVGETLALRLREPSWVGSISLWNGDQFDGDTFDQRSRPTRVLVHVGDVPQYEITILDRPGEQAVTFPEPVLGRSVVIEVLDVAPGATDEAAAVSGLELRGWIARGADREG